MNRSDNPSLAEKIRLDNRFRLTVSIAALLLAILLRSFHLLADLTPLACLIVAYNIPYVTAWVWVDRLPLLRIVIYFLSLIDFVAITAAVKLTGSLHSPFFYLYPVPFLVHAFHFDIGLILFDGILTFLSFGGILWTERLGAPSPLLGMAAGQVIFLGVIIAAAIYTSHLFRKKDRAAQRTMNALRTTVAFLEDINALAPALSNAELQQELMSRLSDVLKQLGVFSRLWIVNTAWKTLQGMGEHPALRPGSPHHLPTVACPAFALRKPFKFQQGQTHPCPSEQFAYAKHLCLPVANDQECFGVLFLASYAKAAWDPEDLHLFEMLAQAIALTLHRRGIFEKLQEKIGELKFSFEVGATGLATFVGSTQSIDQTTIHILDGVLSILKVDRASLMLWDSDEKALRTQWVRGGNFRVESPIRLAMGEGMAGWALKTGEPYWAEYAMTDPHYLASAQPIQALLCVPVFTMEGKPLGVINAVTTQTPRAFQTREIEFLKWFAQQAALAIENAQLHHRNRANIDQLSDLNKMKSHFLSLVSHDLRGPLTGVRGFCEVLRLGRTGPLNKQQNELLDQLERQVNLQERMVDDLLDFARMEKGKLSIHPVPTDLAALLREEVEKSLPEALDRRVALHVSLSNLKSMPPIILDDDRIRQVVWNLIHNALKFTPEEGRVVVRAGWFSDDTVTIEIEDSGVGLSPETQDHVFEKFFQISPGGSKGAQGLGLGLAICKEIVLAHQGTIRAQSPGLGQGSNFSFTLPLRKASPLTVVDAQAA